MGWNDRKEFNVLVGKTITNISGLNVGSDEVIFECSDGTRYKMFHEQDCCESVSIADIDYTGLEDGLRGLVLTAEENSSDASDDVSESGTWTFYGIRTDTGSVWIRWLGESNGYYSESVSFEQIA